MVKFCVKEHLVLIYLSYSLFSRAITNGFLISHNNSIGMSKLFLELNNELSNDVKKNFRNSDENYAKAKTNTNILVALQPV